MDWDKFLLKRAKQDLSTFNTFDITVKTHKHFFYKIKKESLTYNIKKMM